MLPFVHFTPSGFMLMNSLEKFAEEHEGNIREQKVSDCGIKKERNGIIFRRETFNYVQLK